MNKKKINKLVVVVVLCLSSIVALAQNPLEKGRAQINTGFGLSNYGLPVYVGFDYGIHKDISIGGEFSFRSYSENWAGNKYSHTLYGFSGNANYHFNDILDMPSQWNLYAGLNVGFYSWVSGSGYGGSHTSGLGLGGQVGGRYYFTEKLGVNLEFGGGNVASGGKIGITFKL